MTSNKKDLPVNSARLITEQSKGTIKSVFDALVELITNSNDSFRKLESAKKLAYPGNISIYITRRTLGRCESIIVSDDASGMDNEELLKAIEFAGETSGFSEGKKVRGFFGRGLKESIIALGEGLIITKKNNNLSGVRIWLEINDGKEKPYYEEIDPKNYNDEVNKNLGSVESGTVVIIKRIRDSYKIPDFSTFSKQLTNHYQLRGINTDRNREVRLYFYSPERKMKSETPINYKFPESELKIPKKTLNVDGKDVYFELRESIELLDSPHYNPAAKGGVLIKSEEAILENTLFKFTDDQAGLYFFGDLEIPAIAEKMRGGEILVNPNRIGLDWKHPFLDKVRKKLEDELAVVVEEKRKKLETGDKGKISEKNKILLNKLMEQLNAWAEQEGLDWEAPINPYTLNTLMIKPESTDIEIDLPRKLTIYVPKDISDLFPLESLNLKSDNSHVLVDRGSLDFKPHKNYPDILVGNFSIVGKKIDQEAMVIAELGDIEAFSIVRVVDKLEKNSRKRKKLNKKSGGFIRAIQSDETADPFQRVLYDNHLGEIRIYVNFPGVNLYIAKGLEGSESPEGSVLLAELVSEAFCRAVATKGLKEGKFLTLGSDLDAHISAYNRALFDLQKKYLEKLHKSVVSYYKKA